MSRLTEWTEYLSSFGLETRFVQEDSGDWSRVVFYSGGVNPHGAYFPGEGLAIIQSSLWGTRGGLKTLVHEFGHHLVHTGKLSLKGNTFIRPYFRDIPKEWILHYSKWSREEEVVVDCLARWAIDLEEDKGVNKGFKDFLIQLGGAPPPF